MPTDLHKHGVFFDIWSRFYGATPFDLILKRAQDAAIARLEPRPGERVLDLGCGPGRGTRALLERGCRVVAADYSFEMGKRAAASVHGRAAVVRADAEVLPFASGSFDAALCTNSFHHYPRPEASLREIRRVIRQGGRLSLVDPALESLASRIAIFGFEKRVFGLEEVHLYSLDEWRKVLRDAGFAAVVAERGPAFSLDLFHEAFVLAYA
jgi:ubiquinone/menaquinone biosynthesis C-methylase UbiE